MSRYEDRTDPWRVKALRHRIERHDHRNGICELLAGPNLGWHNGQCHLDTDNYLPEMRCSCRWCSTGMREIGRQKRRAGQREARNWQALY